MMNRSPDTYESSSSGASSYRSHLGPSITSSVLATQDYEDPFTEKEGLAVLCLKHKMVGRGNLLPCNHDSAVKVPLTALEQIFVGCQLFRKRIMSHHYVYVDDSTSNTNTITDMGYMVFPISLIYDKDIT